MKLELVLAILMTVTVASVVIYESLPKAQDNRTALYVTDAKSFGCHLSKARRLNKS